MFTVSYCCFSAYSDVNGFFSRMLICIFVGFFLGIFFNPLIVYRVYKVLCSRCYHNCGTKNPVQKFFNTDNKWKKMFTGITKVDVQRNRTVLANKMGYGRSAQRLTTVSRRAVEGGNFLEG